MAIQFDVKSTPISVSGDVYAGPTRLKGITISFASGGTVAIKDGGSGGTTVWSFTAPAVAGVLNVPFPGDGIRCNTSMYCAVSNATAAVVYG